MSQSCRICKFFLKLKLLSDPFKIVIAIALLLSGNVMGVSGERGFALFVCFIGIMIAFSIALAKVLTLNYLMDSKMWSLLVGLKDFKSLTVKRNV